MSREMSRGDGEKEARRNYIRYPVGRTIYIYILVQCSALWASGSEPHARFLSVCSGMVECLASYILLC